MRHISGISALAAVLVGSALIGTATVGTAATVNPQPRTPLALIPGPTPPDAFDFSRPQVLASHLRIPWGLAFLPDGSALVSERETARILRVRPGSPHRVVATVPGVTTTAEGGLLGIAVSPTYRKDRFVYAYLTSRTGNRVVRFRLSNPRAVQVVLAGIPHANRHDGGRIAFGPDGMLYVATGDATDRRFAQRLTSLGGKVLRMTPTGGVPAGNPFPRSVVYSYGHRNVQGMAWDARGRLFISEFGDHAWDEVNLIVPGGNYGWPAVEGMGRDTRYRNPVVVWRPEDASPSGAVISGNILYVAALRGTRLWQVPLSAQGRVGTPTARLVNQFGRLRTVEVAPDGWLWVTTSNRERQAPAAPADDRVLRFPPTRHRVAALSSS
jgi:glucose/arabinose dehydrogenase